MAHKKRNMPHEMVPKMAIYNRIVLLHDVMPVRIGLLWYGLEDYDMR